MEYPKFYWHVAFSYERLCYGRATAGTFILNLLYLIQYDTNDLAKFHFNENIIFGIR